MRRLDKYSMLYVAIGSFIAGRWSRKTNSSERLEGLIEGIPEGYSRALIELYLSGEITKEVFEEFAERV